MAWSRATAAAYLAGMIDGEGTVSQSGQKQTRRVAIANTCSTLIDTCAECCDVLGIEYRIYTVLPARGRIARQDVVIFGKENFLKVAKLPIKHPEKRRRLEWLVQSYRTPPPSKAVLRRMYLTQRMSLSQIALRFNVGIATVRYWMEREGIPRRDLSQAATLDWSRRR